MKKFLSVALAAVMMLSLAACGSSSNKAESSSEGGSASDKTYIIAVSYTHLDVYKRQIPKLSDRKSVTMIMKRLQKQFFPLLKGGRTLFFVPVE